ncbi:DMT family transporter [Thalassotalea fusca]
MKSSQYFELLLLAAIWGSSFLFMRIGSPELGPMLFSGIRTLIASIFLVGCIKFMRPVYNFQQIAWHMFIVGQINTAIPFVLFGYATLTLAAGTTSVLNATTPMFGAIVAYVWLKDKLSLTAISGLVLGFIGVYILVADQLAIDQTALLPALAAITAALCYGISANYTKQYLTNVKPLVLAAGSQISATITILPLSLFFLPDQMPSLPAISSVVMIGVLCTGIAYIIFFRLINALGPAKAITVTYLIPVFGLFWGVIFLQETITVNMLVGCVVILLGVAITTGLIRLKLARKSPSNDQI